MLAIVIFALYVTVCEITMFNLPKWFRFESFTVKKSWATTSPNTSLDVFLCGLQDREIMVDLSQAVFYWSIDEVCTRTHKHTHTHTQANRCVQSSYTYIHAHTDTRAYVHINIIIHTHTHTRARARTHTHYDDSNMRECITLHTHTRARTLRR